ncbi:3beta-hydroxysteroid-dehydrogenase/decarboxylase isoform 2 [Sesamum angolense]|uniref:3beta-hydroxysteroid-dehydrogenase/decarboxylase isoform 2 n=1 Tax=Sesamum angolense TaxID=2727404 RepID=A0AAE1VX07_9LAMI|nr:3beta-hydroxysteroid-dehydrogenase/decarboxylase isoform 2 [Sesamum angolense]
MGGEERWCMVTGGRGFAARHLVVMLIKYDMFCVRIADLGPTVQLDPDEENGVVGEALKSGRAQYVSADLRVKSQVLEACRGAEVVFHMAAPDSSINNHQLHYSVNVQGTKNIIDACIELKVKRLIYTSSPSVIFDGVNGIFNGNESLPYPSKHFWPGDKLLVPSLVAAARAGKSKFIIGDGKNMYDFTYVENVAHAHVCAERALASEKTVAERAAGQAKDQDSCLCHDANALMVELIYKIFAPYGMKVPQLTPSRIRLLSRSRTFDCSKAHDRLGYIPIVSLQEGLRRTIESYPHLRAGVETKMGSQKAVRNKKLSIMVVLILGAAYFSLIATGLGYKMKNITGSKLHVQKAHINKFRCPWLLDFCYHQFTFILKLKGKERAAAVLADTFPCIGLWTKQEPHMLTMSGRFT